jgi:RNA polymerase sigma factor (TIGR02999 family)
VTIESNTTMRDETMCPSHSDDVTMPGAEPRRTLAAGQLAATFEEAYPDLRTLASARLRSRGAASHLDTTALVHETFLRFAQYRNLRLRDRTHFFKYAGRVMRSVIVDGVRGHLAECRGGGARHVAISPETPVSDSSGEEQILRIHEALDGLAEHGPRLVEVVQLRYFVGMSDSEIAHALGVTSRTVRRDWEKARVLLLEVLVR